MYIVLIICVCYIILRNNLFRVPFYNLLLKRKEKNNKLTNIKH